MIQTPAISNEMQTIVQNFNGREGLREMLDDMRIELRRKWRFADSRKLRRAIRRPQLFEKVYQYAIASCCQWVENGPRKGLVTADNFFEYLLEWLMNGGFQAILEFIRQLIDIFG